MVGKYTQTKQRLLRAKIVKSGHGRHYKGALAMHRGRGHYGIRNLKIRKQKKVLRKRSSKKKKDKKGVF